MASDNNLILNLPFDEGEGSTVAYDYSLYRHDAEVQNGKFKEGRSGNCISFEGNGRAEIDENIVNFNNPFTILAWVRVSTLADGVSGKRLGVFCNTAQLEGYRDYWTNVTPGTWYFIVLRRLGNSIDVILDTQQITTINVPTTLTGISILQDVYGSENAYADIDDVKIYDIALSDEGISESITDSATIGYTLGGVNLADLGIRVESSSGILDLPKLKTPASNDWADYHGKVIDLTDKRYQEREITLNCWLKATGKMNFTERVNQLYEVLRKDGTARLQIDIHPTKPLVYEVYCDGGVAPNKRWRYDKMIGTFALKLKEPDPVKRVVRHQRRDASTSTVSIAFRSDKMVNIFWGDGTMEEDVYGDHTGANAITHTFSDDGIYYVVVAGVIEELEDFTTNGIIVWNRL